ncbi:MAG TPA: hypothetical protein VM165_03755, partial [Planctomycetaceae bacterium]|nr:hypothetical protein [Planctomycetaceae bacterium]
QAARWNNGRAGQRRTICNFVAIALRQTASRPSTAFVAVGVSMPGPSLGISFAFVSVDADRPQEVVVVPTEFKRGCKR